jgi:hypothetical protein
LTGGQGGGVGGKASGKDPRAEWSRERVIFVAGESLEGGRDREKVSDREIRGKDGGREREVGGSGKLNGRESQMRVNCGQECATFSVAVGIFLGSNPLGHLSCHTRFIVLIRLI